MMEQYKLGEMEKRLANLIWANAPMTSKKLTELCADAFGWKRTTTYTMLKRLCDRGIFANENGTIIVLMAKEDFTGLCFTNLVDFDALWGHRRNVEGYAKEIEMFDEKLGELMSLLKEDDLLILTADHGNDPTYTGTDHTREKVPFLAWSPSMKEGKELPEQDTFAVVGATIADNFKIQMPKGCIGTSLLQELFINQNLIQNQNIII